MAWFLWRWWRRRKSAITWKTGDNPYPGLAPFEVDRAEVFFGRAQETWAVLRRLDRSGIARQQRFIPLVGPSGSGKSSLVRAGVLPRLSKRWQVIGPMQPGLEVFRDLRAAAGGQDLLDRLTGTSGRVVLVIDQLEDLFTLSRPDERGPFLDVLHEALAARRELHVVVTMRPEFLAAADALKPGLFDQPIPIAALDPRHMRDAIEKPAAAAGVTFERRLVDLMVAEATVGDALPLLGHLLQRLYAESAHGTITIAQYDAAGRVGGAIAEHADAVYRGLLATYPQSVVDGTLLQLVGVEGDDPVRRTVDRNSLDVAAGAVVAELRRARLVTDRADGTAAMLAHDALFRRWETLKALVDTHRRELAEVSLLERRAAAWRESGTDDDLLRGQALARADAAVEKLTPSPALREFLAASAAARDHELGGWATAVVDKAQSGATDDPELLVAVVAAAMREIAPTRTGELAVWSRTTTPTRHRSFIGHTASLGGLAWLADGRLRTCAYYGKICTWGPTGELLDVVRVGRVVDDSCFLSSDGLYVLRESSIWRAEDGAWLADLPGPALGWTAVDCFVVSVGDGGFELHRIVGTAPQRIRRIVVDGADVVSWSPDGEAVAAVVDSHVEVCADGPPRDRRVSTRVPVNSAPVWSPDGRLFAAMQVRVETVVCMVCDRGGTPRAEWAVVDAGTLCWSPDGVLLATQHYANPRAVVLRRAENGQKMLSFEASAVPRRIFWSPDGRTVVAETVNGLEQWSISAQVPEWKLDGPLPLLSLHTLSDASLGKDGVITAIVRKSRPAVIFESEPPRWLPGEAVTVCASPDGQLVAGTDGMNLSIWDVSKGDLRARWKVPLARRAAWSADREYLVCGWDALGADDQRLSVSIFAVADGRLIREIPGYELLPGSPWSPAGDLLALASAEGIVLHNVGDGGIRQRLPWKGTGLSFAWAPDGKRFALIVEERIGVWTVGRTEPDLQRRLPTGLRGLTWSSDGQIVVIYGMGMSLIDTVHGGLVNLPVHRRFLDARWSADLAAVTPDGTVYRWDVPSQGFVEDWTKAGRLLTAEERREFGLPTGVVPASPASPRPGLGP
ncbi:nSTAND1 domain-containing NTPase [Paractinoplanes brasiliensis]|uniref:WD40 repeat protein n=1 Tax=Paractinoplanes brasiliensis TaxID=52695 RepID=A0A4R6K0W1_9ACTN|nr:WD40 repeat protein [Actinoplanes brasiliensis]GID29621.1 hypothetical protein Abr02nite_46040 [Actinoplanes brasiliensis]